MQKQTNKTKIKKNTKKNTKSRTKKTQKNPHTQNATLLEQFQK
jgi:hypothetical protein